MIFVYTGDGKGKTTAAIGQGIRVLGAGGRVYMAQFIKSHTFPSGEDAILASFNDRFYFEKGGLGFVGILNDTLPFQDHQNKAAATFSKTAAAAVSGIYELVIFDELNVALSLSLIPLQEVLSLVEKIPPKTDVMFTGRGAPAALTAIADLVTECREIKHPWNEGVWGKKKREF